MPLGDTNDAIATFFDGLVQRGHEPLLKKARGSIRVDLVDGAKVEHRLVRIDRGDIVVSKKRAAAGGVLRVDRNVFERIASGELNPVAAVLRGEMQVDGDWRLLVLVRRLFPGSPGAGGPRRRAGWAKRRT